MPVPDIERVKALLKPHHTTLTGVVTRAWDRWWTNPERSELYRRVRACLMHNYMMLDAIPGLPESDAIKVVERKAQETALFLVSNELVIRFKKGNESGLSSNIGTQAALDFNDPNEGLDLFGLPDLCRVDVVYVLNELETKVHDILIVARDNDSVIWSYSIVYEAEEAGISTPPTLPTEPPQPPAADSGIRLPGDEEERVKKQATDGTE